MDDMLTLLKGYLDAEGRLTQFPSRNRKAHQTAALVYLASKFEVGRVYREREVNELLRQWHTFEDWAILRRELFEQGYLNRESDGSSYWATPNTRLF
jgi:hypothetical protein